MTNLTTIKEFADAISDQNHKMVVIDFYADWCGPCKKIAPFVYELADKYPEVGFYKIDSDVESVLAVTQACEVSSLPTFCFFINGKYITKLVGANTELLEKMMVENLATVL